MATTAIVSNIAAGHINEYAYRVNNNDPTNSALVIVLFSTGDSIANLRDFDDLAAVIAGASVESAFTNYVRTVLTDADIGDPVVDDTGNKKDFDIADITPLIASAGGAANEDIDMVAVCFDSDTTAGTDANIIPLIYVLDDGAAALQTTNGSDLDLVIDAAGLWSAADATA